MVHSNVVALKIPTELKRRTVRLCDTSSSVQRAIVSWAEVSGQEGPVSVLTVLERTALLTDLSVLNEFRGPTARLRFVGSRITAAHRAIADELLLEPQPSTPIARCHLLGSYGGAKELLSLVLPFGIYSVTLFEI
jgi:hypothetical protein